MSSIRNRTFPALVTRANDRYYLDLTVTGAPHRVRVPPPQSVLEHGPLSDAWPSYSFQALLVASEYCAALLEFLEWAVPPGFDAHKPLVAEYARQLISNPAAPVLPPADTACWSTYSVWSAFTYCYFHGTAHLLHSGSNITTNSSSSNGNNGNPADPEEVEALRWLRRLVGEQGWRPDGAVFQAAQRWVGRMRERLAPFFPRVALTGAQAVTAQQWPGLGLGGWERSIAPLRRSGGAQDRKYFAVYPYRVTGGEQNRVKFTLKGVEAPRNFSNSCGVPAGYSQTTNCALGFLLAADVMQAFYQASQQWKSFKGEDRLISGFFENVLASDERPLCSDTELQQHLALRYPAYLAACTLGWELALGQVAAWTVAVERTAQAAVGVGFPPQLRLPKPSVDPFPLQLPQQPLLPLGSPAEQQQQQQPQLPPAPPQPHQQQHQHPHQQQQQHPLAVQELLPPPSPVGHAMGGYGYPPPPPPVASAAAGPSAQQPSYMQLFAAAAGQVPAELGGGGGADPALHRTCSDATVQSPFAVLQMEGRHPNMIWPGPALQPYDMHYLHAAAPHPQQHPQIQQPQMPQQHQQQHHQQQQQQQPEGVDGLTDSIHVMSLEEGTIQQRGGVFGLMAAAAASEAEAAPHHQHQHQQHHHQHQQHHHHHPPGGRPNEPHGAAGRYLDAAHMAPAGPPQHYYHQHQHPHHGTSPMVGHELHMPPRTPGTHPVMATGVVETRVNVNTPQPPVTTTTHAQDGAGPHAAAAAAAAAGGSAACVAHQHPQAIQQGQQPQPPPSAAAAAVDLGRIISEGVSNMRQLLGSLEQLSAGKPDIQQHFAAYLQTEVASLRNFIQFIIFSSAQVSADNSGDHAAAPPPAKRQQQEPRQQPQQQQHEAMAATCTVERRSSPGFQAGNGSGGSSAGPSSASGGATGSDGGGVLGGAGGDGAAGHTVAAAAAVAAAPAPYGNPPPPPPPLWPMPSGSCGGGGGGDQMETSLLLQAGSSSLIGR
ncbi:hypothetical protein Agub_g3337, partial [Astrephomene gubernaculifera]